jgi:hypothetical protein
MGESDFRAGHNEPWMTLSGHTAPYARLVRGLLANRIGPPMLLDDKFVAQVKAASAELPTYRYRRPGCGLLRLTKP